jgi:ABC-type lipoprotein release transport system permease subunit
VASGVVLFAIALAAGLWPAIRAATTDPSTALRYDG